MFDLLVNVTYKILCLFAKRKYVVFLVNFNSDVYGNLTIIHKRVSQCIKTKSILLKSDGVLSYVRELYLIANAKIVVVDCTHWLIAKININKYTKIIYIGHGGGVFKKMGYANSNNIKRNCASKLRKLYGQYSYVLATTDQFDLEIMQNYRIRSSQIIYCGLPRTDVLVNNGNIDIEENSVFIAPSYFTNSNGIRSINLDIEALDRVVKHNHLKVYISIHPDMRTKINIPVGWRLVARKAIYEKLLKSEIFITDTSSLMFDFSCTRRPIIVIKGINDVSDNIWNFNNINKYVNVCKNMDELQELINNKELLKKSDSFFNKFMGYCNGQSAVMMGNFIVREYLK